MVNDTGRVNTRMDIRTAINIVENFQVASWMRPWLTGQCFDFALALAEKLPGAAFVGLGDPKSLEHVGLHKDGVFYDVRGPMDEASFRSGVYDGETAPLHEIDRSVVEMHCGLSGVQPPYKGVREIAAARKAVKQVYPNGFKASRVQESLPLSRTGSYKSKDGADIRTAINLVEKSQDMVDLSDCPMPVAERDPDYPVYLRIGDWDPQNPRSNNYALGTTEAGLSAYALDAQGQPVVPEEGEWSEEDLMDRLRSDDPKYLVQGMLVGQGHDGEPLLGNPVVVGYWKPA